MSQTRQMLRTKKQLYKSKLRDAGITKEAQQVIDQADEDNVLALQLKADGYMTVIAAKEIEDRKDMIEVMRKDPED